MASIHHHQSQHYSSPYSGPSTTTRRARRHSLDYSSLPSSSTISFKHPNTISLHSHMITLPFTTSTAATTTNTPTTSPDTAFSLDTLQRYLASGDFRRADDETRRLIIVLAGEAAVKRGYVFFSEVQFIPKDDLQAIDELWRKFSNNRFGYSVQRKIWLKVDKDFTRFFIKVGWMKKLDTEIEQFNYRAFPNEFLWELNVDDKVESNNKDSTNNSNSNNSSNNNDVAVPPEGHLPLTNALRGTQLLSCILSHPAFDGGESDGFDKGEDEQGVVDVSEKKKSRFAALRDKLFKPNYSF
ncbi:tetrapyrrole-binding protein, chloroplastic-like [Chenopodium quinoa]|uniref:tetrapyrrole-binding protein, chloroplastic-like n=1 Tax=Chenopodium quinoa TaxID=63459 RepID=UPI000B77AD14|nr:tetrapyrrole-binding protein, chloroplastic-like [Chenopodium quinoa]